MLPPYLPGRGIGSFVRWSCTAHDAGGSQRRHHVRNIRGSPEIHGRETKLKVKKDCLFVKLSFSQFSAHFLDICSTPQSTASLPHFRLHLHTALICRRLEMGTSGGPLPKERFNALLSGRADPMTLKRNRPMDMDSHSTSATCKLHHHVCTLCICTHYPRNVLYSPGRS